MLTHLTGLFSGDYISAPRGCWPLKFLHTLQPPKMNLKSDVGRRAASCWGLPHISSYYYYYYRSESYQRNYCLVLTVCI